MSDDRTFLRLQVRDMQALEPKEKPTDGAAQVRPLRDRTILALHVAGLGMPEASTGVVGSGGGAVEVVIPIRTVSALNAREHWTKRTRRVKAERMATFYTLKPHKPPAMPCVVTMTRLGPSNGLDDDNLRGALKGVRDQIAEWFGIDDRDPRVVWAYGQRRQINWGVEVRFA